MNIYIYIVVGAQIIPRLKSTMAFSSLICFPFLICSLLSIHSLNPFLHSSASSFFLFPFTFLLSLLSFLLILFLSLYNPFQPKQKPPFSPLILIHQNRPLLLTIKPFFLTLIFLLRFQSLRYSNPGAMILSELSGEIAARLVSQCIKHNSNVEARGLFALCFGLFLLVISWDRAECFPVSSITVDDFGFSISLSGKCLRFWPILLPFISGFLWFYERNDSRVYRESMRKFGGQKNVQLISLFLTTLVFFVAAVIGMVFMSKEEGKRVYSGGFIWPLVGIVVFGVVLNENFIEEKPVSAGNFTRKFFVTFVCILMMELGFYYSKISIWGFLVCGLLLGIAVKKLNSSLHSKTRGWGLLDSLDSRGVITMKCVSLQQ